AINRPVLVGAVLQDPVRNAGQLWLPGRGPVQIYVKRRLVPFGEVIPFRSLLARIRAVEHDRAVVVASTTGISAIIAPDGGLLASTHTWQRAEIEATVPL